MPSSVSLKMSEKSTLSTLNLSEQTCELLNRFDNANFRGLSKEKENEIKLLLTSVKNKHQRYNALRQIKDYSNLSNQMIKKELSETYGLNTDCHNYNASTNILFGLNEVEISNRKESVEKFSSRGEKGPYFADLLFRGGSGDVNFPPKLLTKNIRLLEAKLLVIKEQVSILEHLEECKLLAVKMRELLLLKNQTIMKAAETYLKGLNSLLSEVLFLKFTVLKDFFLEDKGVVDASYKLKDHFCNQMEKLQLKEIELQKRIQAFKKLEGTKFEKLVLDYQAICASINERKWTLQNLRL